MSLNETFLLFNQLEHYVKNKNFVRLGSIGSVLPQVEFYLDVAKNKKIKNICEIGFYAGHSTATWLLANPNVIVHSFDFFNNKQMNKSKNILQSRFPERIFTYPGSSLKTIPKLKKYLGCDLVHIDGRHHYKYVILDYINIKAHSHSDTLFLFDDICDTQNCTVSWNGDGYPVCAHPAIAVCDLVQNNAIRPLKTYFKGSRQFGLYRSYNSTIHLKNMNANCSKSSISCSFLIRAP